HHHITPSPHHHMILIADSGSTKTLWAIVQRGKMEKVTQTQGLNPYFTSPELMHAILHDELVQSLVCDSVNQIYFYGAGCSTVKNQEFISGQLQRFFRRAQIEVYHDILGAGRALFGKEHGIACILGTGCNSCFYDGEQAISKIPSLGYLYGDEGAGSNLGKKLLGKYLKNNLPETIREAFDKRYHLTLEDILNSLYNKPFPNRFLASFSHFLKEHTADPFIHDLIYFSFIEFMEAHITRYDNYFNYPTGFIGSIAFQYQDILREAAATETITVSKIRETPVEGLVEYHSC
ncbi:MAG: ATPase, partial [Bacteroidota bacterium]